MNCGMSISWFFYLIGYVTSFICTHKSLIWTCWRQQRRTQSFVEEYWNWIIIRLRSWGIVITLKFYYTFIPLHTSRRWLTCDRMTSMLFGSNSRLAMSWNLYALLYKASYTNTYPICLVNTLAMVGLNKHIIQTMTK